MYSFLGDAYMEQKLFNEALTYYKKALSLDSSLSICYYKMGLIYIELNQISDAVVQFKEALCRDPYLVEAHFEIRNISPVGKAENGI